MGRRILDSAPMSGLDNIVGTQSGSLGYVARDTLAMQLISAFADAAAVLAWDPDTYPATGTVVLARAERVAYSVAASDAEDHHLTTGGGVKLRVLPGSAGYDVRAFGPAMDGVTDDTDAVQAAFDAVEDGGTILFPADKTLLVYGLKLIGKGATIRLNGCMLRKRIATLADEDNMQLYTGDTTFWSAADQYAPFVYCNAGELQVHGPGIIDGKRDLETVALASHSGSLSLSIDRAGIVAIDDAQDGTGCTRLLVRDVEFKDMYGLPVQALSVHDITMERIRERNSSFLFTRTQGAQDSVTEEPPAGSRIIVRDCDLHGTRENGHAPNNCFTVSHFETCIFENNIVDGRDKLRRVFGSGPYPDSPKFQNISNLIVANNTFYASGVKGSDDGTVLPKLNQIVGNRFITPADFEGNSGIFALQSADSLIVADNTFENCQIRALGAPRDNGRIENNTFRLATRQYVWSDGPETEDGYHCLSVTAPPPGSNGVLLVKGNIFDGGGVEGHIGFYTFDPLGRLVMSENIFRNLDNAIAEGGNNDQLHWEIVGNRFENCRTVGELRLASCDVFRIEGNYFGSLDTAAPSAAAGATVRGINMSTNGTPDWDEFTFVRNVVNDLEGLWRLRLHDTASATISRFELSQNLFLAGAANVVDDEANNTGPIVARLMLEGNQFNGNVQFGTSWTITEAVVERNLFSSGGFVGLTLDRTVSGLPANPTAGQRSHVTDADSPSLGSVVVGGGAETVPVFYDGSAWRVG